MMQVKGWQLACDIFCLNVLECIGIADPDGKSCNILKYRHYIHSYIITHTYIYIYQYKPNIHPKSSKVYLEELVILWRQVSISMLDALHVPLSPILSFCSASTCLKGSSYEIEFAYGLLDSSERPLGRVPARTGMAAPRPLCHWFISLRTRFEG